MDSSIRHPATQAEVERLLNRPPQSILLVGPTGTGKGLLARQLAAQLAGVADAGNAPYVRIITRGDNRNIPVESIRQLEQFLSVKAPAGTHKIVIIEDSHWAAAEAQNALLKTLEEPPADSFLILTVANQTALLPTVRSRLTPLQVRRPGSQAVIDYFSQAGYDSSKVRQAVLMSGALPGLTKAILDGDTSHPLLAAAAIARQIIQKSRFERLAMVDALAKDREAALLTMQLLQQMAQMSLRTGKQTVVWQRILTAAYATSEALLANANVKLALTDLMLTM